MRPLLIFLGLITLVCGLAACGGENHEPGTIKTPAVENEGEGEPAFEESVTVDSDGVRHIKTKGTPIEETPKQQAPTAPESGQAPADLPKQTVQSRVVKPRRLDLEAARRRFKQFEGQLQTGPKLKKNDKGFLNVRKDG